MPDKTRRNILKSIGIVSTGLTTSIGIASADHSQSFDEKIQDLIANRKIEEAKDFASDRGIELYVSEASVSSSSGDVSTRKYTDPDSSKSRLWVAGYTPRGEADNRVIANWDIYEDGGFGGLATCPADAAALFWDGSVYTPISADSSNFYPSGSRIEYEGINHYQGALARINDPPTSNNGVERNWNGSFGIELNGTGNGQPFVMEYKHTWIDTAKSTCSGISVGISLGPGTISMNGDVQKWQATAQLNI